METCEGQDEENRKGGTTFRGQGSPSIADCPIRTGYYLTDLANHGSEMPVANTHLQGTTRRRGAKGRAAEQRPSVDIYRGGSGRVMMMGRCSVSLIVRAPAPFRNGRRHHS